MYVQVRLPTKSDKPGSARGPDMEIARKSVSTATKRMYAVPVSALNIRFMSFIHRFLIV